MAVKTILIDDIDGGDADTTIAFVVNGDAYSIDLSTTNANKFWKAIDPYLRAAKKSLGERTTALADHAEHIQQRQAIREWARKKGYDIASRGRIPMEVEEAFNDAHR